MKALLLREPIYARRSADIGSGRIARLVSYDEAGAEHLLGEYTFNHTRTIPGPGGQ